MISLKDYRTEDALPAEMKILNEGRWPTRSTARNKNILTESPVC